MKTTVQQNKNLKWIKQESKENYLRAIYMLDLQNLHGVHYVDVEELFGFSKASVSKAVRILREEGLVTIDRFYCIQLTDLGYSIAEKTHKKYCFFRDLLIGAGVEQKQAEAEACKLEHGISNATLDNLISVYKENIV